MVPTLLTKQSEHSVYSARWGCAQTCIINVAEITRFLAGVAQYKCTDRETDSIVGNWDRTGNVTVCNYEQVGPGWSGIRNDHLPPAERWSSENDQESHCLIMNWRLALRDAFWSLDLDFNMYDAALFRVFEYSGMANGVYIPSHFCLNYNGNVINPDPGIDISQLEVVEIFRI